MTCALRWIGIVCGVLACAALRGPPSIAQEVAARNVTDPGGMPPVMDDRIFTHGLLDQFEDRVDGSGQELRYDGQAWTGTDTDKIWLKSEGTVTSDGNFTDAQHELLYDRAVSTWFDVQGGIRLDLDERVTRTWAALGVQGLALYFFDVEATIYASDRGRTAARLKASTDLLLTNRLILQPEAEFNLYSTSDPARDIGSGLSDIDAGLRLRYEISRKFAPYIGVSYDGYFGQAGHLTRAGGRQAQDVRFTWGVRAWF